MIFGVSIFASSPSECPLARPGARARPVEPWRPGANAGPDGRDPACRGDPLAGTWSFRSSRRRIRPTRRRCGLNPWQARPRASRPTTRFGPHFPGARVAHQATHTYQGQPVDVLSPIIVIRRRAPASINIQNRRTHQEMGWSISTQPPNDSPNVPGCAARRLREERRPCGRLSLLLGEWHDHHQRFHQQDPRSPVAAPRPGRRRCQVAITAIVPTASRLPASGRRPSRTSTLPGILADLERTATADRK